MRRAAIGIALAGLLGIGVFAAPAQGATASCGAGYLSKKIKASGVTCAQAKKVVKEYHTRSQCKGKPCTFKKVGFRWSCESPRPFRNRCDGVKQTADGPEKAFVGWEFAGGEHG